MDRQEIVKELRKLVRSRGNDAVKLAYLGEEGAAGMGRLDLTGVTEFKRSEKGCFEVHFVDRLRALEMLERLTEKDEGGAEMERFLEGLQGDESQ